MAKYICYSVEVLFFFVLCIFCSRVWDGSEEEQGCLSQVEEGKGRVESTKTLQLAVISLNSIVSFLNSKWNGFLLGGVTVPSRVTVLMGLLFSV